MRQTGYSFILKIAPEELFRFVRGTRVKKKQYVFFLALLGTLLIGRNNIATHRKLILNE